MTISNDIKKKLAESREFREEFVAALVKRAFPQQVRTIRKKRGMSQTELAEAAKIEQGVVSRAENVNNGNLTFNTALRVSSGFDLAFVPKIVTFTEFLEWAEEITSGFSDLPSFEEELEDGTLGHANASKGNAAATAAQSTQTPAQTRKAAGSNAAASRRQEIGAA